MDKAEEILDIAMEKMPVAKFGHYSMLIAYVDLFYDLDRKEKARKLIDELKVVMQEKLTYYSQFDDSNIESAFDLIQRNFLFSLMMKHTQQP